MNEQVIHTLFALVRKVICDTELSEEVKTQLTPEMLPQLYAISKAHDMAHIVAQALGDLGLLGDDEISAKLQKQQMLAVYRYQKINYELQQICRTLEEAKIPFIPLKGSVIRQYYPAPWMRTSCDIDVLVHEEVLEKTADILTQKLAYKNEGKSSHDISLFSQSGIHVELHYDTVEDGRASNANRVLSNLWKYTIPQNDGGVHRLLIDEMFYFYHIAHMAKHFEDGGCGIRPFLDLWILEHRVEHDKTARDALLEKGGLLTFANACRSLSAVWFDATECNKMTEQMQAYILTGGVYGNLDNRVAVHQNKKGGKIRYALSRIFLPYDTIKFHYPILQKHKWLTPVMEVRRWFKLLFKGKVKSSLHELNVNKSMSEEQIENTADLLQKLGL
ncbi:MAG: nucleotidyltransferase family protein [Clostridia bacterium]|nr:nucleotidyltransferase family protein [Clostridia bacterium]